MLPLSNGNDTRATPAQKNALQSRRIREVWGKLARVSEPVDPLVPIEPTALSTPEAALEREPSPPAAEGYDPVELRRRMAVCFSGPELRELAESLGVAGSITWTRGPSESARDLIKQFEKYYGLGILVTKLRELRPLVEWPEPSDPALASPPAAPKTIVAAPLALDPQAPGALLQDPLAPSTATATLQSQVAPPLPRAWPGTVAPTPVAAIPGPRGIDPRVLILVAGLTVLAALIAYAAGRASRPPTAAGEAAGSAAPASSAARTRPPGPATYAANAFRRSLDRVVRSCDLPTSADRDAAILGLALSRCGLQLRAPLSALTAPPLEPVILDNPRPQPPRTRPRPAKDPVQAKDPATTKADACIGACESERRSCNDHCGPEPLESSLYDGYMRCRSRCMSATARCRLACSQ